MTVDELNKQIRSGNIKRLYYFCGDEQYLLSHKINSIEKKLITPGTEDFNKFVFEGKKTDIENVIEAVEQYPQMSEKKLVVVKNSGFFNQTTGREYKRIKEAAEELPDYVCLVFIENGYDKKKEKNLKFIEEAGGGIVVFDYLPVNKVEVWLQERFKKAEKRILDKDVSHMVRMCGQSLGQIDIEFNKLLNYVGDRDKVVREDIEAVVTGTVEYRVYDMLDNIIAGKSAMAQRQLKYLKETGEQPTVVLGIMTGKLSEVLMCKLLREDGAEAAAMVDYFDFKKPLFAVNKTIQEGRRYGENYLKRMIKKGLSYDLDIKTGKLDGWTAAEMYLAELIKRPDVGI